MRLELIAFTARGNALAQRLADGLNRAGHSAACTRRAGQRAGEWAEAAFARAQGLIFVGGGGQSPWRSIAPLLRRKSQDPAVVVVDEGGRFAVPILSGHLGGANDLAVELAALLGGQAVLTTATDVNGIFAVDQWARRQGLFVPNPEQIVDISAALLAGKQVFLWSRWPISGKMPAGLVWAERERADVVVDFGLVPPAAGGPRPLHLCPRTLRLGMGCRKGAAPEAIRALALAVLEQAGVPLQAVEAVCTIDLKRDEPGPAGPSAGRWSCPSSPTPPGSWPRCRGTSPPPLLWRRSPGWTTCVSDSALAEGGVLLVGEDRPKRRHRRPGRAGAPAHLEYRREESHHLP